MERQERRVVGDVAAAVTRRTCALYLVPQSSVLTCDAMLFWMVVVTCEYRLAIFELDQPMMSMTAGSGTPSSSRTTARDRDHHEECCLTGSFTHVHQAGAGVP